MATERYRMEYLILLLSGLTLSCAILIGDHGVKYRGETEVQEGDAFQITCEIPLRDPPLWTVNSSVTITEDNSLGYILSEGEEGSFRREIMLRTAYAQLYHEGEYRCNRNSRDFHYVNVIPALADEHEVEEDEDDDDDDEPGRPSYEYKMEINKTYEFSCVTAKDEDTPVTWYKNGGRIIDSPESNVEISGRDLMIIEAQDDDAGEYMCIVEPQYDSGYLGEGRIFRLISPIQIIELPDMENLVQGTTLELQCRTQGYPEPKITWLIGNLNAMDLKTKDKRISVHAITRFTSILIVRNISVADRGLYTCRAENTMDPSSPQIDEESVFVYVRENMIQVNEDYPGLGRVLTPGEPLDLVCNTTECPHCTVVWFKDGEQLHNITDHLEIFGNNTIIIKHATYNDSGIYTCKINRTVLDVDLQATIVVQSKINLKKFDQSSVVVQGSPLELYCQAEGGPMPQIKWYRGVEEIDTGDDERIKILDHEGLKNAKLVIEEADFPDRNHYTCEAYNQIDSVNTTIFIRVKDKLAALWPFLGICIEVAILCTIIFVYERRKSMNQLDEPETDLPTENKHLRDQKAKGQDVRQRK